MERAALEVVCRALERLEQDLDRDLELARVNTVLASCDHSMVLPMPAVSVMEVLVNETVSLAEDLAFRSLEPLAVDGEIWMSPVPCSMEVHPWSVSRVCWQDPGEAAEPTHGGGRVLDVTFSRNPRSAVAPGWLTLLVGGPADVPPLASDNLRATHLGIRLATRPVSPRIRGTGPVARAHVDALCRGLVQVRISDAALADSAFTLQLHFPLGTSTGSEVPAVHANAVPVWNSLPASRPGLMEIDRWAAGHDGLRVFPLVPEDRRRDWRAWEIDRVMIEADRAVVLPERKQLWASDGRWHRALLPRADLDDAGRESADGSVLAVVVDEAARRRAEKIGGRIRIDYRLTQGPDGTALFAGCAFQLADPLGRRPTGTVRGKLLAPGQGAGSGLQAPGASGSYLDALTSLMPSPLPRTVGDIERVIDRRFAGELELVDPEDLVRRNAANDVEPLLVRVRSVRPDRPEWSRDTLLSACQSVLERYLADQDTGGFRLVEARESAQ